MAMAAGTAVAMAKPEEVDPEAAVFDPEPVPVPVPVVAVWVTDDVPVVVTVEVPDGAAPLATPTGLLPACPADLPCAALAKSDCV